MIFRGTAVNERVEGFRDFWMTQRRRKSNPMQPYPHTHCALFISTESLFLSNPLLSSPTPCLMLSSESLFWQKGQKSDPSAQLYLIRGSSEKVFLCSPPTSPAFPLLHAEAYLLVSIWQNWQSLRLCRHCSFPSLNIRLCQKEYSFTFCKTTSQESQCPSLSKPQWT